jgi:ribosomal protein L24E
MSADTQALAVLQDYVGGWKGVGQPRRGSTKDAWIEQADWAWRFADGRASLVFQSRDGKWFRAAELRAVGANGQFELVATPLDGQARERFTGKLSEGRLVLDAVEPAAGRPAQIIIRQVAGGDRLLISYLQQAAGSKFLSPLAEVGYTRKGSNFGKGTSGPECVVTGGYGSMSVEHDGQTFYVCCSGCRDLFNDDPQAVIAEYRQRKAAQREKTKK